jgi:2-oxoglutarate dehydrogenase E1 component
MREKDSHMHSSFASGTHTVFLEKLYHDYKHNPESLDPSWKYFFQGYELALGGGSLPDGESSPNSARLEKMIQKFRQTGYRYADLNPLARRATLPADLQTSHFGLDNVPTTEKFIPADFWSGEHTLPEIHQRLAHTYCRTIGVDYRDVDDLDAMRWLQKEMEDCANQPPLSNDCKLHIYQKLVEAEGFEKFLHMRYLGQKRFSLEGLEALIPLLSILADEAAQQGANEMCLGMAHRGRLNVLANVLQKPHEKILQEFEGTVFNAFAIDGDVKYHLGYAKTIETLSGRSMRMHLAANPSHLEAVNPIVEGFTYARQQKWGGPQAVVPVLLHGDAAFVGQGLVPEVLNLSRLPHYQTGGTIHIVTNNQIGFTTNPAEGTSCEFNSDISKMVRAPVFHVNADDPEAVAWVAQLAMRFRARFARDVVIDLMGYRRHGHNETDEPSFTQPLMYKAISQQPSVVTSYAQHLQEQGVLTAVQVEELAKTYRERMNEAQQRVKSPGYTVPDFVPPQEFNEVFAYQKPSRADVFTAVKTAVTKADLTALTQKILDIPTGFNINSKAERIVDTRRKMLDADGSIDWSFAELLAFASLAQQGFGVRLSGQDCKRGTFSSRHGVLFDAETGEPLPLLQREGMARVDIINSPLSEQGCMGFEFGYSLSETRSLILWEAQFGDFANGAQIIIDQFLVASEAKWKQSSVLTLLLPHGYEGMGPEHSSARLERFLQSCGNLNIQVCNLTTPAQYFHALRRQMIRPFRKPLVIMSPKSLLRHPKVVSPLKDFSEQGFVEAIDDRQVNAKAATRIVMCTGKIYYELLEYRDSKPELKDVAILRLEQLYPFPYETLNPILKRFANAKDIVWVQEEPENMGAWSFVSLRLPRIETLPKGAKVRYVGRKGSGSTAEGSAKAHQLEQKRIVEEAFKGI